MDGCRQKRQKGKSGARRIEVCRVTACCFRFPSVHQFKRPGHSFASRYIEAVRGEKQRSLGCLFKIPKNTRVDLGGNGIPCSKRIGRVKTDCRDPKGYAAKPGNMVRNYLGIYRLGIGYGYSQGSIHARRLSSRLMQIAQKIARLTPSRGVTGEQIAPPEGVEHPLPTPSEGAMRCIFGAAPTPSEGAYIDKPSAGAIWTGFPLWI